VPRGVSAAFSLLSFLVASQALAQIAPPFGLPSKGVLRLQLGTTVTDGGLHAPKRFVHEPSGLSQSISFLGKCGLFLGGPNSLAVLTATGGQGTPGLGDTSIGVQNGPQGVACYRITASIGETLKFGFGPDVSASSLIDATAFYRLELDIEVKQNAEFLLQILSGGVVTAEYRMRSGLSIVAGQGSTAPGSPDHIFNCLAQSDSGPDAGPRDNCRWIVNELGQEFRLVPLQGEGSLEGGGDFGTAGYANDTLIYLTKAAIGALGCNSSQVPQGTTTTTVGNGTTSAQCSVTRIDPTGLGGACTTVVGYILRDSAGANTGCEVNKTPTEQLAASVDIVFPPEPARPLGSEPLTQIQFSTNVPGVLVPFTPQRCIGTVVNDRNGKPTIAEVLSVPGFVPDIVPATPQKDWACILNNAQEYLGNGQMRVKQTILFWGDIQFSRQ
jgi:hypothetical protein